MNLARGLVLLLIVPGCALLETEDDWDRYYPSYPSSPSNPPPSTTPATNQPVFGEPVRAEVAPPPISGGTLHVTKDGRTAIASDPDRDVVYVVDLTDEKSGVRVVPLATDDEPGRVAVDDAGRAHVALRRGGAIVSIDLATAEVVGRRDVCPAPRGITWSKTRRELVVACATGELMVAPPEPEASVRILARLERDLRDVVVVRDRIFVTTFRTVTMIEVARATGERVKTRKLPSEAGVPMIAWRMVAPPEDDLYQEPVVIHEEGTTAMLPSSGAAYYSGRNCGTSSTTNVITSALSRFGPSGRTYLLPPEAVLPVDVAFDGVRYAVVAAGNGHTYGRPRVLMFSEDDLIPSSSRSSGSTSRDCVGDVGHVGREGEPIAVALRPNGVLYQTREPARLFLYPEGRAITLSGVSRADTGHGVFHSDAGGGAACASCHAEGGDDGRVWHIGGAGMRRTPSLLGTLDGTAPFHWDGAVANIDALATDVFSTKMSGPDLTSPVKDALEHWLFALHAPKAAAVTDVEARERGRALFEGSAGCATCHRGAKLTRSGRFDVGTGGTFEVPPLVGVSGRAPFLHDGCGKTFATMFACGTRHGSMAALDGAARADLIAFLESL